MARQTHTRHEEFWDTHDSAAERSTTKRDDGRQPEYVTTRRFPNAHGLDNAGGVHVGKDDLDVGTRDQVHECDVWWVTPDGCARV